LEALVWHEQYHDGNPEPDRDFERIALPQRWNGRIKEPVEQLIREDENFCEKQRRLAPSCVLQGPTRGWSPRVAFY
jgi:hypothetical protein